MPASSPSWLGIAAWRVRPHENNLHASQPFRGSSSQPSERLRLSRDPSGLRSAARDLVVSISRHHPALCTLPVAGAASRSARLAALARSEEHTSELQSLMRISYAVFCL